MVRRGLAVGVLLVLTACAEPTLDETLSPALKIAAIDHERLEQALHAASRELVTLLPPRLHVEGEGYYAGMQWVGYPEPPPADEVEPEDAEAYRRAAAEFQRLYREYRALTGHVIALCKEEHQILGYVLGWGARKAAAEDAP